MAMIVAIAVGTLTAYKTMPETRTRPPFEWVGELVTMIVVLIVGMSAGLAVHIAMHGPVFEPIPFDPMPSINVVPHTMMPRT